VPLIVGGSFTAHAVGSRSSLFARAASADADGGHELVSRVDDGSITVLPLIAGVVLAFALVLVVLRLRGAERTSRPGGVSPLWFLVLPPLAFAIQDVAERVVHAEVIPFNPVHEPVILAGLLLQVPFGLLAYLIGRVLQGVARTLVQVLHGETGLTFSPRTSFGPHPLRAILPRVPVLALGHSVRGPPSTSAI
jgi:hypothetical protein